MDEGCYVLYKAKLNKKGSKGPLVNQLQISNAWRNLITVDQGIYSESRLNWTNLLKWPTIDFSFTAIIICHEYFFILDPKVDVDLISTFCIH